MSTAEQETGSEAVPAAGMPEDGAAPSDRGPATAEPTVTEDGPDTAGVSAVADLDRELRLARATELARAGHRDAAEQMVADLPDPTPSELDLRARIRAQRGELNAADELWAEAEKASGDSGRFAAQRSTVQELQRRRIGTSRLWRGLSKALLALLVVALLVAAVVWGLRRADSGDRELAELRAQQDQILQQLQQGAGQRPQAPALPADVEARLAAPGVDVLRAGDRVTVRFGQAVFTGGSVEPTPEARTQLTELGRRLAALGPDVRVRVIGHTAPTDDPAQVDGGDLGLQRADGAAGALSSDGGPARDSLALLSAGSSDPPFPGRAAARLACP